MSVTIRFPEDDIGLLLCHVPNLDKATQACLRQGRRTRDAVEVTMSPRRVERLLGYLHVAAKSCRDKQIRRGLETVSASMLAQLEPPEPPSTNPFKEEAAAIIQSMPGASIEEINRVLKERSRAFNERPQAELGGCSPMQVTRLLYEGIDKPGSAIRLRGDLSLEQLASSQVLTSARVMLEMIREEGRVKSTANGNLNTAFVRRFAEATVDPKIGPVYLDMMKSIKESNLPRLEYARVAAQIEGLVTCKKNHFQITPEGERLIAEDRAGELFKRLFVGFFYKLDQAYLDGIEGHGHITESMSFILFMIWKNARQWARRAGAEEWLFLPFSKMIIARDREEGPEVGSTLAQWRVLHPLSAFGLLEFGDLPEEMRDNEYYNPGIRVTPLFEAFIEFDLDG